MAEAPEEAGLLFQVVQRVGDPKVNLHPDVIDNFTMGTIFEETHPKVYYVWLLLANLLFCGAQGTRELRVPRARVRDEETGETTEFRSELLPRYARRTREVDEAILGTYLSGANSRRIRKALKPLLGEEHLSKSAVSRVVSRLKERFEEWQNRALSEEVYAIVYLDGFHLKVRMAKRVFSVPVLAALGVTPDGQKRLLSLRLAVSEASTHWGSVLEGLHGLRRSTNAKRAHGSGRAVEVRLRHIDGYRNFAVLGSSNATA